MGALPRSDARIGTEGSRTQPPGQRDGLANSSAGLKADRATAAAAALGVRVVELETRAVNAFDVIDLGIFEVLERERVDVELHAVRLVLLVHLLDLVLEVEVVG